MKKKSSVLSIRWRVKTGSKWRLSVSSDDDNWENYDDYDDDEDDDEDEDEDAFDGDYEA